MTQKIISNRYKIVQILAEGGFGKTYLTEDTHLPSHRPCVLKQLKPVTNNPEVYKLVQERFQREAAILEDLGRTNNRIPELYAYFSDQDQFYLVQEYIEGQTLAHKVQAEGFLSESAVKEILKGLLYVLNYVHSKQIVHRDIKPDNVILRDSDKVPVLIDFGAVRESMGTIANSQGNPISSIVIGTPGFMPPEQAAGRPLYSSDLYSLALTMIYLLTGKIPQELSDMRTGNFMWHQYAMNVSPSLRSVLDKAIAHNPNERYATAKEMLNALKSDAAHVEPEPQTILNSGGKPPNRIAPVGTSPSGSNWVGGGGTFNTSIPVPQEIQGWNWGGFMLSPLWSLTNQVWVGLITWIPIGLPMAFILGARGNTWAWRSRQWRSLEDFKAHQRAWAKAGVITYSCFAALLLLLAFIGANTPEENKPEPSPQPSSPQTSPTTIPNSQTSESSSTFEPVEIGNLQTYTYKTGLFSIKIPQEWTQTDKSTSTQVFVSWVDKYKNAAVVVSIFVTQYNQTQEQLTNILTKWLQHDHGAERDFNLQQPVVQKDGSVRIPWSYTRTVQTKTGTISGESFIEQRGNKISILTDIFPEEQSSRIRPQLNRILNSYAIQP